MESNEVLLVRNQHLVRLLSGSQETVARLKTEVAVLKKALAEQSESLSEETLRQQLIASNDKVSKLEETLRHQLIASNDKVSKLEENLKLQTELAEHSLSQLRLARKELAKDEAKANLLEASQQGQNNKNSLLIDEMLLRATQHKKSPSKETKALRVPSDFRGRQKTRIPPEPLPKTSFSNHTISSKAKWDPGETTCSLKQTRKTSRQTTKKEEPSTTKTTTTRGFDPPPSATKHARSHSYDSYLKMLMAEKLEYSHLHPRNVAFIAEHARALNRSCERQQTSPIQTKRFTSQSQEFKVVTLHDDEQKAKTTKLERDSFTPRSNTVSPQLNATSSSSTHSNNASSLFDMQWLHIPPTKQSTLPMSSSCKSKTIYPLLVDPHHATAPITAKHRSVTLRSQKTGGRSDSTNVDSLLERAAQAERERDALEEELLAVLKTVNQGKGIHGGVEVGAE